MKQGHRNCYRLVHMATALCAIWTCVIPAANAARTSAPGASAVASADVPRGKVKTESDGTATGRAASSPSSGATVGSAPGADPAPSTPHPQPAEPPTDRIETSTTIAPSTVEVTTLDAQSMPVGGIQLELTRDRQSVAEGNTSSKWQAVTDASGHAKFDNVPSGHDSQYRVIAVTDGRRYGTRPFPIDKRAGTKVVLHVYPLVKNFRDALIAGRAFVFVEPRDEVISIEYMQQFHNLGQRVLDAETLALELPKDWKAFATSATDPDLSVVKTDRGVALAGTIAPGQHSVAFTFQIPTLNRDRVGVELNLWPNTAEAQVATLVRPGLELSVDGFPSANVMQGNSRQPMLITGQSYTRDKGPPESIRLELAGLPVVSQGRWVAAITAGLLALGALFASLFGQRKADFTDDGRAAAKKRILSELAALERAHRLGQVGEETFADTKETLLSAFVRIEREVVNS